MCGNITCPLAWRDKLNLRRLANELSDIGDMALLEPRVAPGLVLYDVCTVLAVDPYEVLPHHVVNRIMGVGKVRLWPTLSPAEDEEMIELENVRASLVPEKL